MASTNNPCTKTMENLPAELITDEIFTKLPIKSLFRFKCVSKSYNTLISSSRFIDLHLRRSLSSDANRLLILSGLDDFNLYTFDIDSPDSAFSTTIIPLPYFLHKSLLKGGISIVGSINGLVCVGLELDTEFTNATGIMHVIINPSTRIYRTLPFQYIHRNHDDFRVCFGFGYDEINDDYKLIKVIENSPGDDEELNNREVTVYSLNESSWKLVEYVNEPKVSITSRNGVLIMNHLLHWVFLDSNDMCRIYCFDVRSDKWAKEVPLMELSNNTISGFDQDESKAVHAIHLGNLHGCLCMSVVTNLADVVWIMKDYGVRNSWIKIFEISHTIPRCKLHRLHVYGLFSYRKGSKHEILVQKENTNELNWFGIGSESNSRVEEVKGVPLFKEACFFNGSFLPIQGGHQLIKDFRV